MKFSDRKLLGLKPRDTRYDIREQDGFSVRVFPSGRKVFQFVFDKDGSRHRVTIGEYPTVFSLADAREKHAELYRALKRGEDPARALEKKELTVSGLSKRFLVDYVARENTERTLKNRRMQFDNEVLPLIGGKAPASVTRADVLACLARHRAAGSATAHNHLLGTIKKMFNWAIEHELAEYNPAHLVKLMRTTPRSGLVSDVDMAAIMATVDRDSARILKLCLLTCCRPGEAQNICHEDIAGDWWTCEQHKGGITSLKRTWLTDDAKALIGTGSGLVFPGLIQQNGLAQYVQRKYDGRFQPRDIRRTVATSLRKMGYKKDAVSALLGHSRGVLEETYQLYEYDDDKIEMLTAWGNRLNGLIAVTTDTNLTSP